MVKCKVLTLVGEIRCYRNYRYYHYYHEKKRKGKKRQDGVTNRWEGKGVCVGVGGWEGGDRGERE